jgi:16S rRNA (adenine1518-N6/adenine1519-N6)-dimethyltransferase
MKVNKRFFSPAPKVDSAIIAISNISKLNFKDKKTESNFFNLIKTGFGHKRKVLKKNLELIIPKDAIEKSFLNLKIDPKSRAEDLPLDIWLKLTKSVDTSIGNL